MINLREWMPFPAFAGEPQVVKRVRSCRLACNNSSFKKVRNISNLNAWKFFSVRKFLSHKSIWLLNLSDKGLARENRSDRSKCHHG